MLPVILAAAALGSGLYSAYQQHKAGESQEDYNKRMEKFAKEEKKKQERAARMAALERAIGGNVPRLPQEAGTPPSAPDVSGYNTKAALANVLGATAAQVMADPTAYGITTKPKTIKPPELTQW